MLSYAAFGRPRRRALSFIPGEIYHRLMSIFIVVEEIDGVLFGFRARDRICTMPV
jgi:hypothetical protein